MKKAVDIRFDLDKDVYWKHISPSGDFTVHWIKVNSRAFFPVLTTPYIGSAQLILTDFKEEDEGLRVSMKFTDDVIAGDTQACFGKSEMSGMSKVLMRWFDINRSHFLAFHQGN